MNDQARDRAFVFSGKGNFRIHGAQEEFVLAFREKFEGRLTGGLGHEMENETPFTPEVGCMSLRILSGPALQIVLRLTQFRQSFVSLAPLFQ